MDCLDVRKKERIPVGSISEPYYEHIMELLFKLETHRACQNFKRDKIDNVSLNGIRSDFIRLTRHSDGDTFFLNCSDTIQKKAVKWIRDVAKMYGYHYTPPNKGGQEFTEIENKINF